MGKDEATQAIICTILSASNTSLWRFALERLFLFFFIKTEELGGRGRENFLDTNLKKKKKIEKWEKSGPGERMGRDSSVWCSTLFSWRIMGLLRGCRSSDDSVFACAHGNCECLRLDACAGFMERMELALWNCE